MGLRVGGVRRVISVKRETAIVGSSFSRGFSSVKNCALMNARRNTLERCEASANDRAPVVKFSFGFAAIVNLLRNFLLARGITRSCSPACLSSRKNKKKKRSTRRSRANDENQKFYTRRRSVRNFLHSSSASTASIGYFTRMYRSGVKNAINSYPLSRYPGWLMLNDSSLSPCYSRELDQRF